MKKRTAVFFVDPASTHNLAMYDYELLSRMGNKNIHFFGSRYYDYKPLANVEFHPVFGYSRKKTFAGKGFSYIISLMALLRQAFVMRPKVLHVQWLRLYEFDYIVYCICKYLLHIRLIYTVHNTQPLLNRTVYRLFWHKRFCKLFDTLIVHTETGSAEMTEHFGIPQNKIVVAPHGPLAFDIGEDEIRQTVDGLRSELNLSGKRVLAMLGHQSYYKGTDLVVDAWMHSPELLGRKDAVLLIAGKCSGVTLPQQTADTNIAILPRLLSNAEFASLLKLTDVLLMPYRIITQSGLLLSAVTENVPYCATNIGELAKPIEIADIGWVMKDTSESYIASLLLGILDAPEQIAEKRNNADGWDKVHRCYSWDSSAAITERLYDYE